MNANPDNTPMAQRALKIHDQHGESAMLEYTAASADTKPHGQETNPHSLAVLADHTTVAHTPAAHIFMWMEDQNLVQASRPATKPPPPALIPNCRPAPVAGAPAAENIIWHTLKLLDTQAITHAGREITQDFLAQEPRVGHEEAVQASANLLQAAIKAAQDQIEDQSIWDYMDEYLRQAAAETLSNLPEEQLNRLRELASAKMKA